MDPDTHRPLILNNDPMDLEVILEVPPPMAFEDHPQLEASSEVNLQSSLHDPNHKLTELETEPPQHHNMSVIDDDGMTCPICLDSWANYGDHRLTSLKCGHLFGLNCIERWFAQKQHSCPTCKKKAVKAHLRHIYAKKLIAVDTSEYENIKKQMDEVNERNNKLQIELTRGVCREHLLLQQVENLKKEVTSLNSKIEVNEKYSQMQNCSTSISLYRDKCFKICNGAGCRVLDHYIKHDLVIASMMSPNVLFPGFGVRKISISTYRPTSFIPLHSKSIRDLSVHPQNPWLLSVSLDKSLKIIDLTSNLPISGYGKGEVPLWACCWDLNNFNTLYVGSQQGSVCKFDMRLMSEPVSILDVPGDMSPVISLAPVDNGSSLQQGGIILCKLNSLWAVKNDSDELLPLPMEGPFISMKYQNSTNHLLLSMRPNSHNPNSRQLLCTIENGSERNLLCNIIHSFPGSPVQKYMSRACFVYNSLGNYIAAHQESNRRVFLWSISSGQKVCSVPAHEPVLDLDSFSACDSNFLLTLTETQLEILKFV